MARDWVWPFKGSLRRRSGLGFDAKAQARSPLETTYTDNDKDSVGVEGGCSLAIDRVSRLTNCFVGRDTPHGVTLVGISLRLHQALCCYEAAATSWSRLKLPAHALQKTGEGDGARMWIVASPMFIPIVHCPWFLWVGMHINKPPAVNLSPGKTKWPECKRPSRHPIRRAYGNELK